MDAQLIWIIIQIYGSQPHGFQFVSFDGSYVLTSTTSKKQIHPNHFKGFQLGIMAVSPTIEFAALVIDIITVEVKLERKRSR